MELVPRTVTDPADTAELRRAVRAFVEEQRAQLGLRPNIDTWLGQWDEEFSRALARKGWLGMTAPTEYGGAGRSYGERYAVTEELLAAGAPVAAHWIADRQVIPALLKYGSDDQRRHWIPRIVAGGCFFGIGMSEPDSGSDLASVRTKATRAGCGWVINGTKVWTSGGGCPGSRRT